MTHPLPITTVDQLAEFLHAEPHGFTADLLHLIARADQNNLRRILAGFPAQVTIWEIWMSLDPAPTPARLETELENLMPRWRDIYERSKNAPARGGAVIIAPRFPDLAELSIPDPQCPTCHGTGTTTAPPTPNAGPFAGPDAILCGTCDGTGRRSS